MKIKYTNCPVCENTGIAIKLTAIDHTVTNENFEIWECDKCSLRFTQDVSDKNEIGKYYQSEKYISHTDTKKGLINKLYHAVRERTLRSKYGLINSITKKSDGSILDIGAGTGAFLNYMNKRGWSIQGLEPDETARENAKRLHGLELEDVENLAAIGDESTDLITMWHVLEHVHELQLYITHIKRILKSTGTAFIAVPNYKSYDAGYYKSNWAAYDVPRHLYHFSPEAMRILMQKHGLKVAGVRPMWYDSFYVSMLSEEYKHGKPGYLNAFIRGSISNISTLFNIEKASSVIYIISK